LAGIAGLFAKGSARVEARKQPIDLLDPQLKRVDDIGNVLFTVCVAIAGSAIAVALIASDGWNQAVAGIVAGVLGFAGVAVAPDVALSDGEIRSGHVEYVRKRKVSMYRAKWTVMILGLGSLGWVAGRSHGTRPAIAAALAVVAMLPLVWGVLRLNYPPELRKATGPNAEELPGELSGRGLGRREPTSDPSLGLGAARKADDHESDPD
jgi:hypothetical protein